MGVACIGWAFYVGIRYIIVYRSGATQSLGASEGIYLLPAFYVTVGYMMFLYRRLLWPHGAALALDQSRAGRASVQWLSFRDGALHPFLFMNNTIHSSVAGGLIVIGAINLAAYAGKNLRDRRQRLMLEAGAFALIAVTCIGLYGANSKGVWLALAAASLVQFLMSVSFRGRTTGRDERRGAGDCAGPLRRLLRLRQLVGHRHVLRQFDRRRRQGAGQRTSACVSARNDRFGHRADQHQHPPHAVA